MNEEYITYKDKALIIDEMGNEKTVDYNENLKEILIKENIIEELNNNIELLEKELVNVDIEKEEKQLKKDKWDLLLSLAVGPFAFLTLFVAISNMIKGAFLFDAIKNSIILLLPLFKMTAPVILLMDVILYISETLSNKKQIDNYKSMKSKLIYSKKELEKQVKSLEELKNINKSIKESSNIERVKINNKEILKEFRDKISLYSNLENNKNLNEDSYEKSDSQKLVKSIKKVSKNNK